MIRLILFCLLLAGGVWVGLSLHDEQGMVMVAFGGKSYEMSLFVGAIIAIIAFTALYIVIRMLIGFLNVPGWLKKVRESRRTKRSNEKTQLGLIKLAAGEWGPAEHLLLQGTKHAKFPLLNYLSAAKAASEQGDEQKRDEYLALAHSMASNEMAVGLTQAQLQLNQGQYEQSLATLKHLRSIEPRHPFILKMLKVLYINLKDWDGIIEVLPMLRKYKLVSEEELLVLEHTSYKERLIATSGNLSDVWDDMPKAYQSNPELVAIYVRAMASQDKNDEAESALKYCLKKQWDETCITLYSQIKHKNTTKALSTAEGWLKAHPESAGLLLTCGRLAAQNELWGKAQRYLEACLNIEPRVEAYAALGIIYEKLDKPAMSVECYKKGILESSHSDKALSEKLLSNQSKSSHDNLE